MTRTLLALVAVLLAISSGARAATCPAPSATLPTTTPTPRPNIWVPQQAALRRKLTAQAYPAIALGDSIMQGWSEARLSAAMGMTVLNAGFGQDGTEHVLWRLKTFDWHGQSPRYVLLLAGTDDIGYPTCDIVWGSARSFRRSTRSFPKAASSSPAYCRAGQTCWAPTPKSETSTRR